MPFYLKYLYPLINDLENLSLKCSYINNSLFVFAGGTKLEIFVGEPKTVSLLPNNIISMPIDYIVNQHKKIIPIILSKLSLNTTIFARNCIVQKIDKTIASEFFNTWHFFDATTSAYNYGLFYKGELIGAASFSKGRKMNRLPVGSPSFELIRFCCKSGITITGGLSKLMSYFCLEKNAGDIMTYVDKQFSNGDSFLKAGFKKHSETPPLNFLINKNNFERKLLNTETIFDEQHFYLTQNLGNLKLIYTPNAK